MTKSSVLAAIAALALAVTLAGRSSSAQSPQVEITRSLEAASVDRKPWLVVAVFDRSGSMLRECAEDPRRLGRTNWAVVFEDAESKLQQLQKTLGAFDLRVYTFGTQAAEYARPFEGRTFTIKDASDLADVRRDIRAIRPRNGEGTNLWNSLRSIFGGIESASLASTYEGVVVVVFSDGMDDLGDRGSTAAAARERLMKAALDQARSSIDIRLSVLPIGEWRSNPAQLAQLRTLAGISELGAAIEVPMIASYSIAPASVLLAPLPEAGAETGLPVRIKGFDASSAGAISVALKDQTPGLSMTADRFGASGGVLRFSSATSLAGGASGIVEVGFRDASGNVDTLGLRVVVPSFQRVAPVESWGLPEVCGTVGGRRAVVLEMGQPLDLAIPVPAGATVAWAVDGASAASGPVLALPDLAVGEHRVTVKVSTADETKDAEIVVLVIDPAIRIQGPSEVRAGDAAKLKIDLDSLPTSVRSLLGPATWTVKGVDQAGGDTISVRFDRRGSERVSVRRSLSFCGTEIEFTGSVVLTVTPGPAVRLLGGELVRGREQRIEAALSGADEISRVVFEVDGNRSEANVDPAKDGRPAIAWIRYTPRTLEPVRVSATPIIKDDRGLDREIDDPECASRTQTRVYSVVEPDVLLHFESPKSGAELAFAEPFDLKVVPSGDDATVVERVSVRVRPEQGASSELSVVRSGGWAASLTPTTAMGSSITLEAQAFEATGPIGQPVSLEVTLVAPEPSLVATGAAATGTVTWTGRNESPPPVTVAVQLRGTDRLYPRTELRSLDWSVRGTGLSLESKSEADATAAFAIKWAGPETIFARVVAADGRAYDLSTEVAARPEPVVPGPKLVKRRVVGTATVEIDHADTKGAWTDYRVRGRIGDGEWTPLVEESFDAAVGSTTPAEVEVWYRPWGAEANETPWDGRGGWVRSEPLPLELLKPHSPLLIAIAAAVAVLLAAVAWYLFTGHEFWGGTARWSTDGGEAPGDDELTTPMPLTVRSGRYRFLSKEVVVPIDCFEDIDHPNFGWVQQLKERGYSGRRAPAVRFGKAVTGARYLSTSGVAYSNCCDRLDQSFSSLELSPPEETDSDTGSLPGRRSKPIYLALDTGPGKFFRRGFLPWMVLPATWLALAGAVAVLFSQRVI